MTRIAATLLCLLLWGLYVIHFQFTAHNTLALVAGLLTLHTLMRWWGEFLYQWRIAKSAKNGDQWVR